MNVLTIEDLDLTEKRVLIRVDFNVPLNKECNIIDDTRIKESLPTINYCLDKKAKVILMSHLGRPKGQRKPEFSLKPVAVWLEKLIGKKVIMVEDCIGEEVKKIVFNMKPGEIVLLENLRFHSEEEKNNETFASELASLGELFINDAFGTAHRAHASNVGVTKNLKSASGYLLLKEIKYLGKAITDPDKPFIAILGGAKVSDKINVIKNLLGKVSCLLIGGAMSYTFLKSQGLKIGNSLCENDKLDLATEILNEAKNLNVEISLPLDHIIENEIGNIKTTDDVQIPDNWKGMDIGPKTIKKYKQKIAKAKTVVWNGPMGVFEIKSFRKGTDELAKAISETSAISIIGGGDSVSAINQAGLSDKITHISTGGGASLEFLEGKELPGIVALTKK